MIHHAPIEHEVSAQGSWGEEALWASNYLPVLPLHHQCQIRLVPFELAMSFLLDIRHHVADDYHTLACSQQQVDLQAVQPLCHPPLHSH